ncbi:MAG: putative porin, partial [Bacteroidia bacterium]|nr:putative porin [Bacteroidia bacterium]
MKPDHSQKLSNDEKSTSTLKLFGDVRMRAEQDWDSRNFDGTYREDRFRLRHRLRFGFNYTWNEYISFGARIRSGVEESLQSPHNNFGHREFSAFPVNLDKVYIAGKYDKYWWWVGKNSFPFWKQNELFWDDDVNPEGLAAGASFKSGNLTFKPKAGYFITNTGNGNFDPADPTNGQIDGHMINGQLELGLKMDNLDFTFASGY